MDSRKVKSYGQLIVLSSITLLIFYLILQKFHINNFRAIFSHIALSWLIIAFIINLSGIILGTLRWQMLLATLGHHIPFRRMLLITLGSGSLLIVPGRLGDLLKTYAVRDHLPISQSAGTIILEKAIDVFSLLILAALGTALIHAWHFFSLAILGIVAIIILLSGIILARSYVLNFIPFPKLKEKLENLSLVFPQSIRQPRLMIIAWTVSFTNWIGSILMIFFFFKALHASVPLLTITAFFPFAIFIGLIPLTLAGMGTREAAMITLFAGYATSAQILGAGILYSLIAYWLAVFIGLPFLHHMRPPQTRNNS